MKSAPKKTKFSAKKPRIKPVQRRTLEMMANAIKSLNEGGGSSLRAIKKRIAANYEVDTERLSPFIKEYLKTAVAAGGWCRLQAREPSARLGWQLQRVRKLLCLLHQFVGVETVHLPRT
jgi:hypothetical protein